MNESRPLASILRPNTPDELIGQGHLLAEGKPLHQALISGKVHSMVLWGPPGTGKTTIAKLLAKQSKAALEELSAVLSGVKDIRQAIERAKKRQIEDSQETILFVDEVHRFNKAQQDAFLPFVEDGTVIFVGATTENPSFELNNALLSRVSVYVLKALDDKAMRRLVERALSTTSMTLASFEPLIQASSGDGRKCLNYLELCFAIAESNKSSIIDDDILKEVISHRHLRFDKGGDIFYEQVSALHKSIRGSSPDAALFWCTSMLEGGCAPHYILRRLARVASEDIGNADLRALSLVLNAWDTFDKLGSPEGELAIAQAVLYLAVAPKSNAVYTAYKQCAADVREAGSYDVPMHLKNAPTSLMKALGYAKGYRYAHDYNDAYVPGESYFPKGFDRQYYFPVPRGLELKIQQKMDFLRSKTSNEEVMT